MSLLVLAALATLNPANPPARTSAAHTSGIEARTVHSIEWKVGAIGHTLRVRSDGNEFKLIDRPHTWLRSIVGPMVSTFVHRRWQSDRGNYQTIEVVTQYQGEYQFDLIGWLDDSGQAGLAARQLLEQATVGLVDGELDPPKWPTRPQCPTPDSLQAWDGGFVELSAMLVTAQCFSDDDIRIEPESFWVEHWDGQSMTLAVQRHHCEAQRSACDGGVVYLRIRPPQIWNDWLENATSGQGFVRHRNALRAQDVPTDDNNNPLPAPE